MGLFGGLEASLKLNASDFSRGLRSAQSSTKRFGSVTGETFDDVGDEASAMSRAVSRSRRGFGRLADTMKDTLVPARLLASQLDEVGDEADEAGDQAEDASRGFFALAIGSRGLSFSLGILTTVTGSTVFMLTALGVALGAVMLALAPLLIGFAALGAAFGIILGTGILAWGKGFQKALKNVWKQIKPLLKAFGKQFIPFLKETIKMLPGLVKSLLEAIGPMDVWIDALSKLRDIAFAVLPKLINWFFDIGRKALPVVMDLATFIMTTVVPALRTLTDWGFKVWDTVKKWVGVFTRATSKGTTLRKKFNKLVLALQDFWKNLQPVIKALKPLGKQFVKLAPVIVGVALDIARLAVIIGTKLLPYLVPLTNFLTGIFKWFNKLSPGIKRAVIAVGALLIALGPIISILGTLIGVFGTVVTAVGTVIAIFNPLTLAIIAIGLVIGGLAYLVYKHWNDIVQFTRNLVSDVTRFFTNLAANIMQFQENAVQAISDFVSGVVNWFKNLHTRGGQILSNAADTFMDYVTGRRGPLAHIGAAGKALIDEFISGIQSKISDVISTVEGMLQSVRNRLPFSPAKYGPLSDLDKTGPAFVKTFAKGIRNSTDIAVSAAQSVAQSVMSVFDQVNPQFGLFAGERSRVSLKGLFKGMPSDLIADLLENFTEGRINVGRGFQSLSSVIGLKEYVRAARRYGFIERRNGQPVFREDTAIVGIENVLNDEAINFKIEIDTDDEALAAWVSDKANVVVNQNVRQALDQADRRRTFR